MPSEDVRTGRTRQKWGDLPVARRRLIVVAGAVEVALAATAWVDLIRRPANRVRGPKRRWAAVIAVNVIGPLVYFRWGRLPAGSGSD